MRIHSLEHAPFEGPGRIATWAGERGHTLSRTALYDGEMPPAPDAFDLLVIMGGPMSIHEHRAHPWLPIEKRFLTEAIRARKPILPAARGTAAASGEEAPADAGIDAASGRIGSALLKPQARHIANTAAWCAFMSPHPSAVHGSAHGL